MLQAWKPPKALLGGLARKPAASPPLSPWLRLLPASLSRAQVDELVEGTRALEPAGVPLDAEG